MYVAFYTAANPPTMLFAMFLPNEMTHNKMVKPKIFLLERKLRENYGYLISKITSMYEYVQTCKQRQDVERNGTHKNRQM